MRSDAAQSRRDTYLGIAAATLAVAYLLGVAANITLFALDRISFLGSALSEAGWLFQVCGWALPVVGFAVIAVAFIGREDARGARLRLGALALAGGYGVILVGGVLLLVFHYRDPDPFLPDRVLSSVVMQVAAYLSALVAAVLAATAFGRPRSASVMEAAVRNRRLGWASIGFALEFTLLLLSGFFTTPVVWGGVTVDLADGASFAAIAAIAAAVVAAVGFFGAARAYRLPLSSPLPRREGVLAVAAMLYLLYRVLELTELRELASWLWQLEYVALAVAALFAVVGFVVSRRSFLGRECPSLSADDD